MSTREELARQAEKSLRQGRVDEAIVQYQELASLAPVDWGLVRQLADLLERTGQREGAARQFARWADHLFAEGFHTKAAALYKKVLKLEDNDEHALWQLGEVSLELKLRADSRVAFQRVADLRLRRGDASGAGAARERLAMLDAMPAVPAATPATPPAYAYPRLPADTPAVAAEVLPEPYAEPLAEPRPEPLPAPRAETAIAPPELDLASGLAEPLDAEGQALLDVPGRQGVGDPHRVLAALLPPTRDTTADDDRNGDEVAIDLAWMPEFSTASETFEHEPAPERTVPEPLAQGLASSQHAAEPAAGSTFDWSDLLGRDVDQWGVPPLAASAAVHPELAARYDVASDHALLVASLPQMPAPEPLLVDEPDSAEASAREALAIVQAEELLASLDPPAPRDTFAFTDGATRIGELRAQPGLSADVPLQPSFSMPHRWLTETSEAASDDTARRRPEDDFLFDDDSTPARWASPALRTQVQAPLPAPASAPPTNLEPPPGDAAGCEVEAPAHLEVLAGLRERGAMVEEEVDLTQLLEELKQWDPVLPEARAPFRSSSTDMPLTGLPLEFPELPTAAAHLIADAVIEPTRAANAAVHDDAWPAAPMAHRVGSAELDAVFADMQHRTDDRAVAEQQLAAGRVFLAAGLASEAARAFERAAIEPRSRFAGTLALAELHKSRGQLLETVAWYEQAATAPVPDAAVKRAVLYDLAESLEALGETDRALGVLLDLLSQVEDYRDARARLDRLLRVDAGG